MDPLPDAIESVCGVAPHSCDSCRKCFAFDFSKKRPTTPAKNPKAFELWSRYIQRNSWYSHAYLNIDLQDLEAGAALGCVLCEQWISYAAAVGVARENFALAASILRNHLDVYIPDVSLLHPGWFDAPVLDHNPKPVYVSMVKSGMLILSWTNLSLTHSFQGSPASDMILRHNINYTPGSPASLEKSARWLQNCRNHHKECGIAKAQSAPRYLIHISQKDANFHLKLLNCERASGREYVCLSYCWVFPSITTGCNRLTGLLGAFTKWLAEDHQSLTKCSS